MGKFRVMVGVGESEGGASTWSAVARQATVDDTSSGRVEGMALTSSPVPAATAGTGGSPSTLDVSSLPSPEFDVDLVRVGASAVVAVRSRRPA